MAAYLGLYYSILCYKAFQIPQLARPPLTQELLEAAELVREAGLSRLDRLYLVAVGAI